MRTRTSLGTALLAVLAPALVSLGAAGANASAAPTTSIPPPPPTCTCPPATTAVPAATTVPNPATTAPTTALAPTTSAAPPPPAVGATTVAATAVPGPAGAGLPANATVDQLVQAIQPMFGPSTDVMGEFALFSVVPIPGVPTPVGTDVAEFFIEFDDLTEEEPFYRGIVVLTSTQPAAEMVTLYQTELVAAGFTQTGDAVDDLGGGLQIRSLEYQIPNAAHPMSSFRVEIHDDDVDSVYIEWHDALDTATAAAAAAAFTTWSGLPLTAQADRIEDATIGNHILGDRLGIGTSYHVATPQAELEAQFLAALAGTPFTVNPDVTRPGEYAALTGGPFEKLTAFFGGSSLDESTSELSVEAVLLL